MTFFHSGDLEIHNGRLLIAMVDEIVYQSWKLIEQKPFNFLLKYCPETKCDPCTQREMDRHRTDHKCMQAEIQCKKIIPKTTNKARHRNGMISFEKSSWVHIETKAFYLHLRRFVNTARKHKIWTWDSYETVTMQIPRPNIYKLAKWK